MRFATAACMQKYGNVSFATVACAKCMRYGGRGGGPIPWGGGGGGNTGHGTIYTWNPNDPCFEWSSGLLLEGLNPKIEDNQVPGISIYIYICIYILRLYRGSFYDCF